MSSIIFHTNKNQAIVATDTLATSYDGKPAYFTSKALILPHLRMIVAGTGIAGFVDIWFIAINGNRVQGIDHLNHHAPRDLATLWTGYKHKVPIPDNLTMTVYHFGFSETTKVIRCYAYRSDNGFRSELLQYGTALKPRCKTPKEYKSPKDFKQMMNEQREIQALEPKGDRLHIGGEIQIHRLTRDGFNVYTLAKFDDYEKQKEAVYSR